MSILTDFKGRPIIFPQSFKMSITGSTALTGPSSATGATGTTGTTGNTNTTGVTGTPGVNPSGYTPMTDIVWNQTDPINPVQVMNGDNFKVIIGIFSPKPGEGVGPYSYYMDNYTFDQGCNLLNSSGSITSVSTVGWVGSVGNTSHLSDPINLRIVDGIGNSISKTVTPVVTTASAAIVVSAARSWFTNQVNPSVGAKAIAIDGTLNDVTVTSSNNTFFYAYGGIFVNNYGPIPPVGTYPVTLSATGYTSRTINITVNQASISGPIYFIQNQVSTSQLSGTIVGQLACTTPSNNAQFTIIDPSFCFSVNTKNQIVLTNSPAVGNHPVTIKITDGNINYSQNFNINIIQGNTLSPDNISMTLNSFTNYAFHADYSQRQVSVSAPTVTGFPDLTKVTWSISKIQRFCYSMDVPNIPFNDMTPRGGIGRPRFACNTTNGIVYVQCQLSDTTGTPGEWFDLSATDGINTCTKRFYLQVTPVVGPKLYVGPNAAPNGMTKYNTILAALTPYIGWQGDTIDLTGIAGAELFIEHDPANPNRYVNDWRQNNDLNGQGYYSSDCQGRRGINGPLKITGIPGPDGTLPYYGGVKGSSNCTSGDKGLLVFNVGDIGISNMELGFIHMNVYGADYAPASNFTQSLIRQNGGCSGDIRITNCDLHDADVPLEAGHSDGQWIINNVRLYNGSGCTSQGGANQHNAYIGHVWNIVVNNLLTFNAANGHIFKCRAANGTWTNSRFYDSSRGSGFNCLDLCCGGNHTITNCHFQKGPMSMNPFFIQFAEEVDYTQDGGIEPILTQNYVHSLTINTSIFSRQCPDVIGRNGINFNGLISPNAGVPSSMTVSNTTWENISVNQKFSIYSAINPEHDFTTNTVDNNPTYATTFTPLNFTTPVSYDYGRPGWHDSLVWLNNGNDMPYFNARQIDPGVDQIRIPANSAPGTIICANIKAYGAPNYSISPNTQPDPLINPYINGTTWGFGQTLTFHTGESFNYNNNKYVLTNNSDGITATLSVGANGLTNPGLDVILIRATSPTSHIVENPFAIIKT